MKALPRKSSVNYANVLQNMKKFRINLHEYNSVILICGTFAFILISYFFSPKFPLKQTNVFNCVKGELKLFISEYMLVCKSLIFSVNN